MKTCTSCGSANGDGSVSCQWCGATLPATEPGAAPKDAPLPAPPGWAGPLQQYTHSGLRYLLGYTPSSFGIWDRERPEAPVETFPRTDEGWRAAWLRYSALEPTNVDVGLGVGVPGAGANVATHPTGDVPPPPPGWPTRTRTRGTVSGWWWILPIVMGWLGGLIAWLVVRDDDPQTARWMLIVGIAITVVGTLLVILPYASLTSR
jgi:hypothetical protein